MLFGHCVPVFPFCAFKGDKGNGVMAYQTACNSVLENLIVQTSKLLIHSRSGGNINCLVNFVCANISYFLVFQLFRNETINSAFILLVSVRVGKIIFLYSSHSVAIAMNLNLLFTVVLYLSRL